MIISLLNRAFALLLFVTASSSQEAPVCSSNLSDSQDCVENGTSHNNHEGDENEKKNVQNNNKVHKIRRNDSLPRTCGLYLAPNTKNPKLHTLYTGVSRAPKERLGDTELVLSMIDANKNEYSLWQDYAWNSRLIPSHLQEPNENTLEFIVGGIGSAIGCANENTLPNVFLLEDEIIKQCDDPNCKHEANCSPNSCYHNVYIAALRYLEAGEELVMDCTGEADFVVEDAPKNRKVVVSVDYLLEKGVCFDAVSVGPSTLVGAGRGGFSNRNVVKGDVILVSPVLHFDRSQTEILQQSISTSPKYPFVREHGIEYTSNVVAHQLIMNYCLGHPNSDVLLFPYAQGVNFINHNDQPNAYIRWSSKLGDSKALRNNFPVLEFLDARTNKLAIEFVALRDIAVGEEIFIDYGLDWSEAWMEHNNNDNHLHHYSAAFRHEIQVPDHFFPPHWMRYNRSLDVPDFIANPLKPGYIAPVRWFETREVVAPWVFRIGLHRQIRDVLLDYCERVGILDTLAYVTKDGNSLNKGENADLVLDGEDWYLQRPASDWRSNLHWLSPGGSGAHVHYLQALGAAGFDDVLESIGEYLGLDGLAVFHVTFIAVSHSTKAKMHYDMKELGGKAYNLIVPLILVNDTDPELAIQDDETGDIGRYHYEYEAAIMVGDDAYHGTSAVDYRRSKQMRLAATIYLADLNEENADAITDYFTQAYPPADRDLMLSWAGSHWKRGDPSKKLPKPDQDHVLFQQSSIDTTSTN